MGVALVPGVDGGEQVMEDLTFKGALFGIEKALEIMLGGANRGETADSEQMEEDTTNESEESI